MEGHGAIRKKSLNFCYKEVPLFEEISHLELIALQLATLRVVQNRCGQHMQRRDYIKSIPTWTPPGRLTDESMRTASCRALASTFHLRGCTFSPFVKFCCGREEEMIRTSVIRPITRSPTSGLYLNGTLVREVDRS